MRKVLMGEEEMKRSIRLLSLALLESMGGTRDLFLVRIQKGGVNIATRIRDEIEKIESETIPVGLLDITLYGDDIGTSYP